MAPGRPGKPARKRNRKRKRRVVSSDSSSSDEDTSSSSEAPTPKTVTTPVSSSKPSANAVIGEDEDDPSSSSEESQDDSGLDEQHASVPAASTKPGHSEPPPRDSPSPPPDIDLPPFLPPNAPESERALKEKFRKFWMTSIAEGFKDDLEEIRKEPNLGPSRLALLIESLASGAEVFSSGSVDGDVNEMEVVMDQLS